MPRKKRKPRRKFLGRKCISKWNSKDPGKEHTGTASNENQGIPEDADFKSEAMDRLRDALLQHAKSKFGDPLPLEMKTLIEVRFKQISPQIHTPDHPPYSEMIFCAITALNGEEGSSEASISAYIKSRWNNLSLAHNSFLSLHLGKLTQKGEIIATSSGLFLFPKAMTDATSKQTERGLSCQGILEQPLEPVAEEGKALPTIKRRGRPAQAKQGKRSVVKTRTLDGHLFPTEDIDTTSKQEERDPELAMCVGSLAQPLNTMVEEGRASHTKRRGRQPKAKQVEGNVVTEATSDDCFSLPKANIDSTNKQTKTTGSQIPSCGPILAQPLATMSEEGKALPIKRRRRPAKCKQGECDAVKRRTPDGAFSFPEEIIDLTNEEGEIGPELPSRAGIITQPLKPEKGRKTLPLKRGGRPAKPNKDEVNSVERALPFRKSTVK